MKPLLAGIIITILLQTFASTEPRSKYDMAVSLILYELSQDSYLKANSNYDYYISVQGVDLPPKYIALITSANVNFFPGSKWAMGKGMHMNIEEAKRRSDGDYDIPYSYYCGILCSSGHTAVMRIDKDGWHVLSTKMLWIS